MRFAGLCGATLLAFTASAFAADLPILRGSAGPEIGPAIYYPWQGFYFGGQGSWTSTGTNFNNGTGDLVAFILRNTTIENEARVSNWTTLSGRLNNGAGYGGFIGYNAQWDDAVIGVELNYTHADIVSRSADSIGRSYQTSDGYFYDVLVSGAAVVRMTDLGSLRLRGGWSAFPFMPYGFVGLAIGRADISRSATVDLIATDISGGGRPTLGLNETRSENRTGVFGYGYSAGGGIDFVLLPNLFLRAEYEYMRFPDYNGVNININTVRGGLAAKF